MDFFDWINKKIIGNGLLCEEYTERVRNAKSRKELFEICCDANGLKFIPEMANNGHPLPYDVILDEFKNFINGKYVATIKSSNGDSYTSAIYCKEELDLNVETTGLCLLGCRGTLHLKTHDFAYIVVDGKSHIKIDVPNGAEVKIIAYGDATIDVSDESINNVKIKWVE